MSAIAKSLLFFIFINVQTSLVGQQTCTIEVTISNIRSNTGQLMVSIHTDSEGFPHKNMFEQLFISEYSYPTYTVVFKDVPYGEAAISVLHDENKSGKMDFNFFHFPNEGFAFYKNYKVTISRPDFEDVKFKVNQNKMVIETPMQY